MLKKTLTLSFVIVTLLITACQQKDKKELIVRKWKCENVELSDTSTLSQQDKMDFDIAKAFLRNATYEYFANERFEVNLNNKIKTGTWKFSDDKKYLLLQYDEGKVKNEKYEILHISESELQLKFIDNMQVIFTFIVYNEKFTFTAILADFSVFS